VPNPQQLFHRATAGIAGYSGSQWTKAAAATDTSAEDAEIRCLTPVFSATRYAFGAEGASGGGTARAVATR
jgi:hypothetical protein